jgi:hypothetical protein
MTVIKFDPNQTIIEQADFTVKILFRYKGSNCERINVWRLPGKGSLWSMLNTKNLVWSLRGEYATMVQGWFTPPPVTRADDKRAWYEIFSSQMSKRS